MLVGSVLIEVVFVEAGIPGRDRKSTRLNSSHVEISYAVFCLKKKKNVVKEQLEIVGFSSHVECDLAADESEYASKFQKKVAEMEEQFTFYLPFLHTGVQRHAI